MSKFSETEANQYRCGSVLYCVRQNSSTNELYGKSIPESWDAHTISQSISSYFHNTLPVLPATLCVPRMGGQRGRGIKILTIKGHPPPQTCVHYCVHAGHQCTTKLILRVDWKRSEITHRRRIYVYIIYFCLFYYYFVFLFSPVVCPFHTHGQ